MLLLLLVLMHAMTWLYLLLLLLSVTRGLMLSPGVVGRGVWAPAPWCCSTCFRHNPTVQYHRLWLLLRLQRGAALGGLSMVRLTHSCGRADDNARNSLQTAISVLYMLG